MQVITTIEREEIFRKAANDAAIEPQSSVKSVEHTHSNPSQNRLSAAEQAMLSGYQSHDLSQLKNASLMDRVDTKYVLPRQCLCDILAILKEQYSVLEINNMRTSHYLNAYYDTPAFTHYNAHHNRRLNRFKLRKRVYQDSELAFLEVKFKNNHGRTVKTRKPVDVEVSGLHAGDHSHIDKSGLQDFESHQLMQNSSYNRIALANEAQGERITIDLDLHVHDTSTDKEFDIGDWMIVEVKQNFYNRRSVFFQWAKENGFRSCSFSKYCMGVYYTGPEHLKRNNFHKINRQIAVAGRKFSKTMNEHASTPSIA